MRTFVFVRLSPVDHRMHEIANHSGDPRPARPSIANASGPSGIAQLRKTSQQSIAHADLMNLDGFVVPENVGAPAGLTATPSPEATKGDLEKLAHSVAAAIPIKSRKDLAQLLVPQSVPVPPNHQRQDEFGYVTRHHRKTSIDERRVSSCLFWTGDSTSYLLSLPGLPSWAYPACS